MAAIEAVAGPQRDLAFDVTVVVGPLDDADESLIPAGSRHHWTIAHNPSNLAELMNQADLAISTAGVSLAELACLGVPTIGVIAAENQTAAARALGKLGAIEVAGTVEELADGRLTKLIERLARDPSRRKSLATTAQQLIDGDGVKRIARAVRDLTIHLRPRRSTICKRCSLGRTIPRPGGRRSVAKRSVSTSIRVGCTSVWPTRRARFIWRVTRNTRRSVAVRFLREADEAIVSVNIAADQRGQQRGTRLIHLACRRYFFEHDATTLVAQIKPIRRRRTRRFAKSALSSAARRKSTAKRRTCSV